MKKKLLALFAAGVLAFCAFAAGCTPSGDAAQGDDGSEQSTTPDDPKQDDEQGTTPDDPKQDNEQGTTPDDPKQDDEQGTTPDDSKQEDDDDVEERKLRVLPPDFKYEIAEEIHTVSYKDSEGKDITLYGKLWFPDAPSKYPAVILCHGFNGHYTDFPTECKAFAERGYVCYAFDFCGAQAGGKSTGRTAADYTPFTMKEDLRAALADIKAFPYVDGTQVFLFGGSQGGFVTALTAADNDIKDEIAGLAMYFPALNIPDDWRGKPVQDTPLMGYSIGAKFIKSVQELDPFTVIGNYKKDVCIVWGDQDELVARKYIDNARAAYGADRVDLTIIPGAGHGFGGTALQTATQKVLAFLEARTYVTKKK